MGRFKKTIRIIHRWLGFISGLLILFLGITGCILAFQKEIENSTQPYRYVHQQSSPFLPPTQLKGIAEKRSPGKHVHAVLYEGKSKAAQVIFFHPDPFEYYSIYLNPYNGEVLKIKDMEEDFFYVILMGHYYLWLPENIGQPIVTYGTMVFVIMMISGIILWWPKTRSARKQRFRIQWTGRWRRKNYDLHYVLGFYMFWIAIIIALTGMVFGFQWFASAVYKAAGGNKSLEYAEPFSDTTKKNTRQEQPAIDKVWYRMQQLYPNSEMIEVHIPETNRSPIAANANPDNGTYWQTDYRYFDQFTFSELRVNHIYGRQKDANAADKIIRMNYDIHTGAILGLPGKILVFFASLIAASLPVTGFMIWRGRRKKRFYKPELYKEQVSGQLL